MAQDMSRGVRRDGSRTAGFLHCAELKQSTAPRSFGSRRHGGNCHKMPALVLAQHILRRTAHVAGPRRASALALFNHIDQANAAPTALVVIGAGSLIGLFGGHESHLQAVERGEEAELKRTSPRTVGGVRCSSCATRHLRLDLRRRDRIVQTQK